MADSTMPNNNQQTSTLAVAACVGAVGGFGIWFLFLFFLFAFPDAQGGIGLVISPFFSTAVGVLLAASTWGFLSARRGNDLAIVLALPAVVFLLMMLAWFISEIWQLIG